MKWRQVLNGSKYRPVQGETRQQFLARVAVEGFPPMVYAEPLRSPVWELCREVESLRRDLDALRAEVVELRTREHR
jgi:hypothetical protein